jgi:hypothetical protein
MPAPKNQARVLGREMRWAWEELNPAPLVANTSAGFQIGSKLYILSGDVQFLGGAGMVPQALVSLDLGSRQWQNETAALPAELAVAHAATMLVGGRHLFIAGGQSGDACSPPSTAAHWLDLHQSKIATIPSLPQPRYGAVLALLGDNRLHMFGGLLPDGSTPARERWSLSIDADGSIGDAWRQEPPLPAYLGGAHGTVVQLHPQGAAEPALYFWGRISQELQPADDTSDNASCIPSREWGDAALWSFNLHRGWRRHRDLPLPLQHTAGCTVKLGQDTALVVGGQHYAGWLSRTLWLYNATEDSWARVGHAPLYNRGHVCGLHDGHLFMALGQQGQEEGLSAEPGMLSQRLFWAPLPSELVGAVRADSGVGK